MSLNFKRRELELNVYGNDYKLSFPSVKQTQDYAKKAKRAGDDESASMLVEFLDKLGLPKDISLEMEAEHLTQVVEALIPQGKK